MQELSGLYIANHEPTEPSDCQIMILVLTSRGSPTPSTLRLGPRSKDRADLTHVERDGSISDSQVPVRTMSGHQVMGWPMQRAR